MTIILEYPYTIELATAKPILLDFPLPLPDVIDTVFLLFFSDIISIRHIMAFEWSTVLHKFNKCPIGFLSNKDFFKSFNSFSRLVMKTFSSFSSIFFSILVIFFILFVIGNKFNSSSTTRQF